MEPCDNSGTCVDRDIDSGNCGACGNRCGVDQDCCSGRCVSRGDAERFCGGCGMYQLWPDGCDADETCDRGVCISSGGNAEAASQVQIIVISESCPADHPEWIDGPYDAISDVPLLLATCAFDDGVTADIADASGAVVASCTIAGGICRAMVPASAASYTVTMVNPPAGTTAANNPATVRVDNAGAHVAQFINVQTVPVDIPLQKGQLAYAVKNAGHWDVWLHDFATSDNTQLTNLPESDQWAPAWSHDGKRLAYLSDQTDGTNQVWLMDPDGKNQRQLTKHAGSETVAYVAWSPKDDQLIVTLHGKRGDRLVTMPVEGGAFSDYKAAPASFASTSDSGHLAYVTVKDGVNAIQITHYDPNSTAPVTELMLAVPGISQDAPNLNDGGSAVIFQSGDKGARRINYLIYTHYDVKQLPQVRADDSNPIWFGPGMAFVSDDGSSQSVIYMPFTEDRTPYSVPIAPHEQVWYLAARPKSTR
jgi:hypothetical protein